MKNILLKKYPSIDYALLARVREDGTVKEFVAAWGYDDETKSWSQGHYFVDLDGAMEYINGIIEERKAVSKITFYTVNTVFGKSNDWMSIPCIKEMECSETIVTHLNEIGYTGLTSYNSFTYKKWEHLLNDIFKDYIFGVYLTKYDSYEYTASYLVACYKKE